MDLRKTPVLICLGLAYFIPTMWIFCLQKGMTQTLQ